MGSMACSIISATRRSSVDLFDSATASTAPVNALIGVEETPFDTRCSENVFEKDEEARDNSSSLALRESLAREVNSLCASLIDAVRLEESRWKFGILSTLEAVANMARESYFHNSALK
jgi:hypothetical protein